MMNINITVVRDDSTSTRRLSGCAAASAKPRAVSRKPRHAAAAAASPSRRHATPRKGPKSRYIKLTIKKEYTATTAAASVGVNTPP